MEGTERSAHLVAGALSRQPGCQTFPETGKQVCGVFLAYWKEHGALPQQGFPLTNEFKEVSEVDGKTYTVQYFERAVFEHHPENKPPHDVLLSLLGNFEYNRKYPNGAPNQQPNTSTGSMHFKETGKRLGGPFLAYWNKKGGLAQQGYPISDEFQERSNLDGKTYRVQYFERAVFELHPENKPPYDVLLSQLGTFQLKRKYPAGQPGSTPTTVPITPTPDEHTTLRQRPLRVPTISPGAACPKATGRVVAPEYGPALGNGPVYAVGMGTEGVMSLTGAMEEGGWLFAKVLWAADPKYKGPILVRGRQVDGTSELRFDQGSDPPRELRLHTETARNGTASGWRDWPSYTRLRGPGCYAYQVDGIGFSEVIVFQAER
jgi:hypothetical protein